MVLACKQCGASATVVDGNVTRKCGHDEAGVTADLSATCYGESGCAGHSSVFVLRFLQSLRELFSKLSR